ncbi:MAG: glucose-1-phosphate cytidylyltransferase [Methanospirillaceae archaeon]|nr:glucose-1-phosphate cytidylyltransferase [Methanospirillaceae archaeon]
MKTLILAGGFGTRLAEETHMIPKPMLEIGGHPILWHIMKLYSHYGFNEFVILLGYKGYIVKEYIANYCLHQSDITINLSTNTIKVHNNYAEPWIVTLVDTGLNTMTGGRILRVRDYLDDEPFMLTYGDGVSNINIAELLKFHTTHGHLVTVTSVQPEGRYGTLSSDETGKIDFFVEKPAGDGAWINAGYFVCNSGIFDYLRNGDATILEREPLEELSRDGELFTYKHTGFWKCMDTQRDMQQLNQLWNKGHAKWNVWE